MYLTIGRRCRHCGGKGETKTYTGVGNDYEYDNCYDCGGTGVTDRKAKQVHVKHKIIKEHMIDLEASDVLDALAELGYPIPKGASISEVPTENGKPVLRFTWSTEETV